MRSVVGGQKGLAISQTARFPVLRSSVDEAIQGKIQCGDLAAYTQRGFIGNDRIVKYNGVKVTFRYRDGETNEDRYRTLSAVEFMELYLQHVLPKGVQRIRYGGIWAAAARKRLNAAKEILILQPVTKVTENPEQLKCLTVSSFIRNERFRCPKCGAKMLYRQQRADSG